MKNQDFRFPRHGRRLAGLPGRAGLFLLLVLSRIPQAQQQFQDQVLSQTPNAALDQLAPSPEAVVPQTAAERASPGAFQVFAPAGEAPGALDQPFEFGNIVFRPHVSYRFLYGNGIQSSPGNEQNTIIQEISPGILIELGRNWVLDYTPTLRYYSSRAFQDGLDQSVVLHGTTTFDNWALGLSQGYNSSTSPTVETGSQVNQEAYDTALTASSALNDSVSVDLGVNQSFDFAQDIQNSREWSSLDWVNFKIWTRLNFGLGAGGGYESLSPGPNQAFEQYEGRFNWRVTDTLSIQANAGVEDRQFLGGGRGNLLSPIYGATIQYQMFEYTAISVNTSSSVSQSLYQDQVTQTTTVGADFNQRLLGKLHLDLGGNYSSDQYISSTASSVSRTDDDYSFSARLSCPLLKRGTFGVSYQYGYNKSSAAGFTYGTTQFGFDIGYSY